MAFAPLKVQNMPDCFRREPMTAVPDALGSVSDYDLLLGTIPAAIPGFHLARSPLGFLFDNGSTGPIHLQVENGNRLSHDDRQVLASLIEGRFRPHQRQHAAYAGRQIRLVDVQSGIGGELPVVAVRAEIPGAQELDLAHCGEYMPVAHLAVARPLTAEAGNLPLIRAGRFASKQLAQRDSPGLVHGSSHRHLDRFQVQLSGFSTVLKDDAKQPA